MLFIAPLGIIVRQVLVSLNKPEEQHHQNEPIPQKVQYLDEYSDILCNMNVHAFLCCMQITALFLTFKDKRRLRRNKKRTTVTKSVLYAGKYHLLKLLLLGALLSIRKVTPQYLPYASLCYHVLNAPFCLWASWIIIQHIFRRIYNSSSKISIKQNKRKIPIHVDTPIVPLKTQTDTSLECGDTIILSKPHDILFVHEPHDVSTSVSEEALHEAFQNTGASSLNGPSRSQSCCSLEYNISHYDQKETDLQKDMPEDIKSDDIPTTKDTTMVILPPSEVKPKNTRYMMTPLIVTTSAFLIPKKCGYGYFLAAIGLAFLPVILQMKSRKSSKMQVAESKCQEVGVSKFRRIKKYSTYTQILECLEYFTSLYSCTPILLGLKSYLSQAESKTLPVALGCGMLFMPIVLTAKDSMIHAHMDTDKKRAHIK